MLLLRKKRKNNNSKKIEESEKNKKVVYAATDWWMDFLNRHPEKYDVVKNKKHLRRNLQKVLLKKLKNSPNKKIIIYSGNNQTILSSEGFQVQGE